MKKYIIPLFLILACSCSEFSRQDQVKNVDIIPSVEDSVSTTEIEPVISEPVKKIYSLDIEDFNPKFETIEHNFLKVDKLAVVGSSVARYYPYIELNSQKDVELLGEGEPLPIGEMIKILETVEIIDTIHEGFFRFEKDNNYFYRVLIDGRDALVWGADLVMMNSISDAIKTSWYYTQNKENNLYKPFNGRYDLSIDQRVKLSKHRLNKEVTGESTSMIDYYLKDSRDRTTAMFFTSDYIFYTANVLLQEVKESYLEERLEPLLREFLNNIITEIEVYINDDNGRNPSYSKKLDRVYKYFLVAKVLINHIDDEVLMEEHLRSMPNSVIDEYYRVLTEDGYNDSLILDGSINYGGIDGDGRESSLYLALEWLSTGLSDFKRDISKTRFTLILLHIISESSELLKSWEELNTGIKYFHYAHSTLDIKKIQVVLEEFDTTFFPYWIEEDSNITDFNQLVAGEFSLFSLGEKIDERATTYLGDSDRVSSPLDIIAMLGSKTATSLLEQSESDNETWAETTRKFNLVKAYIDDLDREFWEQSLYTKLMNLIPLLSQFEQSRTEYFREKGLWNQKTLLSSVGAWNDLVSNKRVTLKKERSEEEYYTGELSFRVEDTVTPTHYIEPNEDFFYGMINSMKSLYVIYSDKRVEEFIEVLEKLISILDGQQSRIGISSEDNDYLQTIPALFSKLVKSPTIGANLLSPNPYRWFITLDDRVIGKKILTGYGYSIIDFWIDELE